MTQRVGIMWSWQFLPSNRDECQELAKQWIDNATLITIYYNHTRKQVFFECDGSYGQLVLEENEP